MNNINITSAQYVAGVLSGTNTSIRATIDGQELFVPLDPTNRHYQAILKWIAEGNTIQEASE